MKIKTSLILILCSYWAVALQAQTARDSSAWKNADWQIIECGKNWNLKTVVVNLFDSPQQISVLEYRSKSYQTQVLQPDKMTPTSVQATQAGALAAINGSFYNMSNGWPVTFIRSSGVGYGPVLTTNPMMNGAVVVRENLVQILPWDSVHLLSLLTAYPDVMQAGPLLLKNNQRLLVEASRDMAIRHPRTAIGVTRNGRIICVVVDGRHKQKASGMNFTELTWIMQQLGCCDALNLDGGGSSTLWSRNQGVVNYPSDNRAFDHAGERSVANIIAILPLKSPVH